MKLLGRLPAEGDDPRQRSGHRDPEKEADMTTTDIPIAGIIAPAGGCSGPVDLSRTESLGDSAVVQSLLWAKLT